MRRAGHHRCGPFQVLSELQSIAEQAIGTAVDPETPLMAAGLDSLAAVELKNAVAAKFGVSLPATVAFDYPTLVAMSRFVASSLPATAQGTQHWQRHWMAQL